MHNKKQLAKRQQGIFTIRFAHNIEHSNTKSILKKKKVVPMFHTAIVPNYFFK